MKGGIYVHIPYCAKRCTYCAFVSGAPHSTMPLYIEALKKEMASRLNLNDTISTIYIGGGTPSVLYRGAISDIISFIRDHAHVEPSAEITVECNPDSVTPCFVEEIVAAGVNRVSMGLQTDNDQLLKRVNRLHDRASFLCAYNLIPILNKSVDLMLGLPGQTSGDLMSSLQLVTELHVPHISLYALKSEEGTLLYNSGFAEDEDFEAELYQQAYSFLTRRGYRRYEVSNFCLEDMYSRHNISYWDLTDYYGFGISAHSLLGGFRMANTDNINKYILHFLGKDIDNENIKNENLKLPKTQAAKQEKYIIDHETQYNDLGQSADEPVTHDEISEVTDVRDDRAEEYIMLALRTLNGIDLDRLKTYGVDLIKEKGSTIDRFIKDGFLVRRANRLILSDSAFFVMNSIISELI